MAAEQTIAAPASTAPRDESTFVYEWPIRVWHWTTALAIPVLAVTGYLIGSPPPSIGGEASEAFLFGYIRSAHFIAGYILAIGLVLRTYWALVGNKYARQIYTIPLNMEFVHEAIAQLRFYLLIDRKPPEHNGHNPLARMSMLFLFLGMSFTLSITGLALYGEGAGIESWQYKTFGWVFSLLGNSQWVHTVHHSAMWVLIVFVMAHIYAAIREDVVGRGTVVSTMFNGWRTFRAPRR